MIGKKSSKYQNRSNVHFKVHEKHLQKLATNDWLFLLLFWKWKRYLPLQLWNNLVIIIFNAFWNCGKQHIYDLLSKFSNLRAIIKDWIVDILRRNAKDCIEAIAIHIMILLVSSSSRNIICDFIIHLPSFINKTKIRLPGKYCIYFFITIIDNVSTI